MFLGYSKTREIPPILFSFGANLIHPTLSHWQHVPVIPCSSCARGLARLVLHAELSKPGPHSGTTFQLFTCPHACDAVDVEAIYIQHEHLHRRGGAFDARRPPSVSRFPGSFVRVKPGCHGGPWKHGREEEGSVSVPLRRVYQVLSILSNHNDVNNIICKYANKRVVMTRYVLLVPWDET